MDKLFEESFIRPTLWRAAPFFGLEPALDIYETADNVVVKAALPGVKPDEIDISVTGNTLTIKGETKAETEVKKENYICQERRYGAFSRSVSLPGGILPDKAEASFENGVLILTIPKAEEVKPKTIKVKAKK
jgi:HSP20 family protein